MPSNKKRFSLPALHAYDQMPIGSQDRNLADHLCQREFVILVTFVIASGTKRLSCGSTACLTIHAHACWN